MHAEISSEFFMKPIFRLNFLTNWVSSESFMKWAHYITWYEFVEPRTKIKCESVKMKCSVWNSKTSKIHFKEYREYRYWKYSQAVCNKFLHKGHRKLEIKYKRIKVQINIFSIIFSFFECRLTHNCVDYNGRLHCCW